VKKEMGNNQILCMFLFIYVLVMVEKMMDSPTFFFDGVKISCFRLRELQWILFIFIKKLRFRFDHIYFLL